MNRPKADTLLPVMLEMRPKLTAHAQAAAAEARCQNMIARVRKLPPPTFDEATIYLLGPGCARCRPTDGVRSRPAPVLLRAGGTARPDLDTLRAWVQALTSDLPPDGIGPLPTIHDEPVHPSFR